jgi:hypothetical protein
MQVGEVCVCGVYINTGSDCGCEYKWCNCKLVSGLIVNTKFVTAESTYAVSEQVPLVVPRLPVQLKMPC